MPVITVQFIKDVVATPEQKRQIVTTLTEEFVAVLGEVVRPFVYCIIDETPQMEWSIAGVPMPDLAYLSGPEHARVIERSNEMMRAAVANMAAQNSAGGANDTDADADDLWRGSHKNGGGGAAAAVKPEDAHARAHHELFQRWFSELWNKGNYAIVKELVDPGFVAHGAGGQDIRGTDGIIEMVKVWRSAMPDGHMTMDDVITEGDLSTIRMTWRGTHLGTFYGIPASGAKIEVTSIGIDRVIDGHITEGWGELNMLGMMQQMGAIPTG